MSAGSTENPSQIPKACTFLRVSAESACKPVHIEADRQIIDNAINSISSSFGAVSETERISLANFIWQRDREILD